MTNDELLGMWASMDDTPEVRENFIRSPFPYPGNKTRTLEKLLPHLPYGDIWIEAFGGTGAVTLARRRSKLEVFNDRHSGIVSFYRCIRDPILLPKLIARLDLTVHSREEFIWSYNTWEHNTNDDVERAARWYYSIMYSFGRRGEFFGRVRNPMGMISGVIRDKLPLFYSIHERFKNVQIENLDFRVILRDYDSNEAVHYLDPPFYEKNYYKHNMSKKDHIEMCERIFSCKGYVALSGYDNPIYDKFPWDKREEWPVSVTITTRAIETDTSNAKELGINSNVEKLWIKYSE